MLDDEMYPKVAVLLAAYNGLKYLPEQLESIYGQDGVQVNVYLSVDASNDGTEKYIASLAVERDDVRHLEFGSKFGGAAKNFFHLLESVDFSEYDYIALADQDDIWESDKLKRGISKLKESSASGYSSNVMAFWEDGREVIVEKSQPQVEYDYLFEAAGPGCTYIMDLSLACEIQQFIKKHNNSVKSIDLHDWFIYAYARSSKRKWFIDSYSGMRYRQHGGNQVGANNSLLAAKRRWGLIKTKWYYGEIVKISTLLNMSTEPFIRTCLFGGYMGAVYLALHVNKVRRRTRDRWALALVCLLGVFS
ncbi:glycosyltransferase [Aeromonas caviae]